jgi:D-3-phosphoglycerate dehydrogenase
MRVIGTELEASRELERELSLDWLGSPEQLEAMLGHCDVVSIQVPMGEETRSLIDRREFGWMKNGAVLINTARAPIVDYEALFEALSSGKLAGAGLGVWWTIKPNPQDPLLNLHNVIYMSHTGSLESAEEKAQVMVDNIIAVRQGRAPRNITNL